MPAGSSRSRNWAADADAATLEVVGAVRGAPRESRFRRTLQRRDADAVDGHVGGWAQQRTRRRPGARRRVTVDGTTLHGSGRPHAPGRPLLAAVDHVPGAILAQVAVAAKTSEIPLVTTLLDRVGDLSNAVVTADARLTPRDHATYLPCRAAHSVLTVKAHQPAWHRQLARLPWRQLPVADRTRDCGRGRAETRTRKATAVTDPAGGIPFPHAAQAIQLLRRRRPGNDTRWTTETVSAVTSLTATDIGPADLAGIIRGHWASQDRLHYVRDLPDHEDRSPLRTGNGPRLMASLRHLALTIHRRTGATTIAAALGCVSKVPWPR